MVYDSMIRSDVLLYPSSYTEEFRLRISRQSSSSNEEKDNKCDAKEENKDIGIEEKKSEILKEQISAEKEPITKPEQDCEKIEEKNSNTQEQILEQELITKPELDCETDNIIASSNSVEEKGENFKLKEEIEQLKKEKNFYKIFFNAAIHRKALNLILKQLYTENLNELAYYYKGNEVISKNLRICLAKESACLKGMQESLSNLEFETMLNDLYDLKDHLNTIIHTTNKTLIGNIFMTHEEKQGLCQNATFLKLINMNKTDLQISNVLDENVTDWLTSQISKNLLQKKENK